MTCAGCSGTGHHLKELGRYSCTATYNHEFKNKTRAVQISYALKYLENQKKSQATVSVQRVKTDYFIADAGGWDPAS